MRLHQIPNNRTSVIELNASHGTPNTGDGSTPIVIILDNSTTNWRNRHPEVAGTLSVLNAFITEIRVTAFISGESLPEVVLTLSEGMDRYEANKEALRSLWQDQRFHLKIWYKSLDPDSPSQNWCELGYESMQNKSHYPYSLHDLFEFFSRGLVAPLGENDQVGLQVVPVMWGGTLLTLKGTDKISLRLHWKQEAFLVEPDLVPIGVVVNSGQVTQVNQITEILSGSISTFKRLIMESRADRMSGRVENQGTANLNVYWGDTTDTSIDAIVPPGGNVPFPIPYTGPVTLQSTSGSLNYRVVQVYQATM